MPIRPALFVCVAIIISCQAYTDSINFKIQPIEMYTQDRLRGRYHGPAEVKALESIGSYYGKRDQSQNKLLNISDILHMFEEMHCHVTIDNFENIDILPSHVSAVLKRPKLAVFDHFESTPYILWIPFAFKFRNYTAQRIPKYIWYKTICHTSLYFSGVMFSHRPELLDMCTRLNLFSYSARSKPWNCQIQISLLLNPLILLLKRYPPEFNYDVHPTAAKQFPRTEQSMIPKLQIFVNHEEFPLHVDHLRRYLISLTGSSFPGIETDDMYYPTTHYTTTISIILGKDGNRITLQNLHHVDSDASDVSKMLVISRVIPIPNLKDVFELIPPEGHTRWYFKTGHKQFENSIFRFARMLKLCKEDSNGETSESLKLNDMFAYGIASMLFDITGNATIYTGYDSDHHQLCRSGESIIQTKPDGPPEVHLILKAMPLSNDDYQSLRLSFEETVTQLAFVSCGGGRGDQSHGISELLVAYDTTIWVCIILTSIVLAEVHRKFLMMSISMANGFAFLFQIVKLLLEQGDPFPGSFFRRSYLRITCASIMLVGTVLSNAYKNTNVYNMISPKQLVPYTQFSELVEDGFDVATRISNINFFDESIWPTLSAGPVSFHQNDRHHIRDASGDVNAESEIVLWASISQKLLVYWNSMFRTMLRDKSRLLRNSSHLLTEAFFKNKAQLTNLNASTYDMVKVKILDTLHDLEDVALKDHLKNCSKRALLLPSFIAKQYAIELFEAQPDYKIYVGQENYLNLTIGLQLDGMVHPNIIKRLQAIKFSGIWDRWSAFTKERNNFKPILKDTSLKRPDMHGNVSTIFLVLVAGILLATVSFVLENSSRIQCMMTGVYKYMMHVAYGCCQNIWKFRKITGLSSVIIVKSGNH